MEIGYDLESLRNLHTHFVDITGESLNVVNFFEQRETTIFKIWFYHWRALVRPLSYFRITNSPFLQCVPARSATYDGTLIDNISLSVDHSGLNKFRIKDENYRLIRDRLIQIISSISVDSTQVQGLGQLELKRRTHTLEDVQSSATIDSHGRHAFFVHEIAR
jgi:hypothetical protein